MRKKARRHSNDQMKAIHCSRGGGAGDLAMEMEAFSRLIGPWNATEDDGARKRTGYETLL